MDTMNFKKYAIILLLFVSLKSVVYSQQPDYQTRMDTMFNIPAYKVTTGLLIERSPNIIDMQDFILQSNVSNAPVINLTNINLKQTIL